MSRPPFPEQVVALRVDRPPGVELADVGDPILDLAPALENQGAVAVQGEKVACEQAGGARADNHRTMGERDSTRRRPVELLGLEPFEVGPAAASDELRLPVRDLDLGRVDKVQVVVPARVEALAEDPPVGDRVLPQAEPFRNLSGQRVLGIIQFQANVSDF